VANETHSSKSERTRRRIVDAAARAYREHGLEGVGVREIMKRAGLTQGGFYFHFPDKEALFNEASREATVSLAAAYVDIAERAAPGKKLRAFIDAYLSAEHRQHPESGCLVSALASEVARGDRKVRAAFSKNVAITLERLAPYLPGATAAERTQKAGLLLASMAGVLMVARMLSDPAASDSLLAGARQFFSAAFGED
jgi:TetR/AcrR family transcriptional repressor of nem operon